MNNFEAKYLKISKDYLDKKIKLLNIKKESTEEVTPKKESTLQRIVTGIFK